MKQIILGMLAAVLFFACKKEKARQIDTTYNPIISAANFTNPTALTNPYFTFEPGKKYIFEGQTEDGFERIEIQLTNKAKTVLGIACAVVNDKVWTDLDPGQVGFKIYALGIGMIQDGDNIKLIAIE